MSANPVIVAAIRALILVAAIWWSIMLVGSLIDVGLALAMSQAGTPQATVLGADVQLVWLLYYLGGDVIALVGAWLAWRYAPALARAAQRPARGTLAEPVSPDDGDGGGESGPGAAAAGLPELITAYALFVAGVGTACQAIDPLSVLAADLLDSGRSLDAVLSTNPAWVPALLFVGVGSLLIGGARVIARRLARGLVPALAPAATGDAE
jgi:hypothetical protein